jgi:hypothetical protein
MSASLGSFLSLPTILSLHPQYFSNLYKAFSFWKVFHKNYYKKVSLSTKSIVSGFLLRLHLKRDEPRYQDGREELSHHSLQDH